MVLNASSSKAVVLMLIDSLLFLPFLACSLLFMPPKELWEA